MVISSGFPALARSQRAVGVAVSVAPPAVEVVFGVGLVLAGVTVGLVVGEGVPVCGVCVTELVFWVFTIAAMVWYTWVWFGVAVLMGRLLAEIRVMRYHSRKMLPAATASHTRAVNKPNLIGARFVADIEVKP